ncbi:MAG: T9SS type A sorting domain-containing protein [Saprospiraceae bacterium]
MKTCLLLLMFLLRFSLYSSPTIWYVNHAATGANTGLSWEDAFNDMQDAIAVAQYGDHIWVAKGTYYPTQDGNREISFVLNNGVQWYGGFEGGEMSLNQRDWELNETILSGEIGNPDSLSDNSLHVVYGEEADSTTLIDGFTIIKGHAKPNIETGQYMDKFGGGMFIDASKANEEVRLIIKNCLFENNYAKLSGGGIAISYASPGMYASPKIINSLFINNISESDSGALVIGGVGGSILGRTEIISCSFINNISVSGGAIGYSFTTGTHGLLLKDCLFHENVAFSKGGACFIKSSYISLPIEMVNCTFSKNQADGISGGSAIFASTFYTENFFRLENCRFLENKGKYGTLILSGTHSILEMDLCVFEFNGGSQPFGHSSVMSFRGRLIARNCKFNYNFGNSTNSVFNLGTYASEGLDFINCSFMNHHGCSTEIFRVNFPPGASPYDNGTLRFRNCIFQDNRNSNSDYPIFILDTGYVEISHSLINEPSFANCQEMLNLTPVFGGSGEIFCNEGMLYNTDALFVSAADEDYRLQPCSPLRNAGTNIPWDTLPPQLDLEGNARIQEGIVDIGPYEVGAVALWADSIQPVSCPGYDDGAVWLQGSNTCDPAQYAINGLPLPSLPASNLAPGEYVFTITDALNRTNNISLTLEAPVPMTAMAQVLHASGLTAADGQIWLDPIEGGAPPYTLLWSNGATSDTLTALMPGIYTLIIKDSLDCTAVFEWEVGFTKSLGEVALDRIFKVWPNPAKGVVNVELSFDPNTPYSLRVFDLLGHEALCVILSSRQAQMDFSILPPGIYILALEDPDGKTVSAIRLVVGKIF